MYLYMNMYIVEGSRCKSLPQTVKEPLLCSSITEVLFKSGDTHRGKKTDGELKIPECNVYPKKCNVYRKGCYYALV